MLSFVEDGSVLSCRSWIHKALRTPSLKLEIMDKKDEGMLSVFEALCPQAVPKMRPRPEQPENPIEAKTFLTFFQGSAVRSASAPVHVDEVLAGCGRYFKNVRVLGH